MGGTTTSDRARRKIMDDFQNSERQPALIVSAIRNLTVISQLSPT
jgi:hypothetical protein